jgi:hypothetical protein
LTEVGWSTESFTFEFHRWLFREHPPREWWRPTLDWIAVLEVDHHSSARPDSEVGLPWWFAIIPGAGDDHQNAVCSFTINEATETIRCAFITSLSLPI